MKKIYTLMAVVATLGLLGCKQQAVETTDSVAEPQGMTIGIEGFSVAEDIPVERVDNAKTTKKKSAKVQNQKPMRSADVPRKRPSAKAPAIKETHYVETESVHGRVWGHVTMKGDRGHGTIHDEGENTYTVSVTRHGNELFAVDQNSRQYVFKLKQNKTQE